MTYAQVAELVDAHVSGACVERHAGSSPVLGTLPSKGESSNAEIAQLVEHNLAKVRVASSSLVFRSFQIKIPQALFGACGIFCCMEVVVTVSVMRIRASFRRSCWPASRYSSEWSCCFCWRKVISFSSLSDSKQQVHSCGGSVDLGIHTYQLGEFQVDLWVDAL